MSYPLLLPLPPTSGLASGLSSDFTSGSATLITRSFAIFVVLFRLLPPCVSTLVGAARRPRGRCHLPGRRTPPAPCRSAPGAHLPPFARYSIRRPAPFAP